MFKIIIIQLRKFRTSIFLLLGILLLLFIVPQQLSASISTKSILAEATTVENVSTNVNRSDFTKNMAVQNSAESIVPIAQSRSSIDWIKLNDRNRFVEELQSDLKSLGYEPVGKTSGLFDKATERAVRRFQRSAGLVVDGIVGPITHDQLAIRTGSSSSSSSVDRAIANNQTRASLPPDIQRIKDREKLVVAILNRDNPPFFMEDEKGQMKGADVKMARAIASALDVDLEFRRTATTFNEVVDDVYALNADLAISKVSRTLDRAKRIRFSQPYLNLRQGLLISRLGMAKNNSYSQDVAEKIRNLTGKVGVIKESSYASFAQEKFPKAEIISYASWPKVIEAMTSGELLGAYRDELEIKKTVLSRPDAALQFQTVALTDTQDPLSVVLPWDSEHLLAFVNQYLESSDLDYTTESLLEEYADYFQS